MTPHTKPLRSFRFWTILVPLIMTIASLIGSSMLWMSGDDGTLNLSFWELVTFSAACGVITGASSLLHFYLNLWVDDVGNSWTGRSYCEKVIEPLLTMEKLNWRLRRSTQNVFIVTVCTSPIGLAINVVGIGIAIVRFAILLVCKIGAFLWSCRPGIEGVEQS